MLMLSCTAYSSFNSSLMPVQNVYAESSVVDSIPITMSSAQEIALNPNSNMIYTMSIGSGDVLVINGESSSQIATLSTSSSLRDIAVNPGTNLIYATTGSSKSVIMIDGSTNNVISEVSLQ